MRERSIKVVKFSFPHKGKKRNGKLGLRIKRKMANQPADTSVEKLKCLFSFVCFKVYFFDFILLIFFFKVNFQLLTLSSI